MPSSFAQCGPGSSGMIVSRMRIVAFAGDAMRIARRDRPRRVVTPVVEDRLEQVSVAARQLVLEEITGLELDPVWQLALRLRDHVRQLEHELPDGTEGRRRK